MANIPMGLFEDLNLSSFVRTQQTYLRVLIQQIFFQKTIKNIRFNNFLFRLINFTLAPEGELSGGNVRRWMSWNCSGDPGRTWDVLHYHPHLKLCLCRCMNISIVVLCRSTGRAEVDSESDGASASDRPSCALCYFDVCNYRPWISQWCLSHGLQATRYR